jgi:hypothetical protein
LLLAMWVLVQIVDTIVTGVQPALASDPRLVTAISVMGTVLFLTRWLGLLLVVPFVVQTHPLVGSDAFWMTRPIPWRALFASKIILLGTAFVAVPALCEVVLMLACRVPIAEIALVASQTILFHALWLLVVMALAAITRDFGRFALVAGGLLVAFVLLVSTSLAVMFGTLPDGPQLSVVSGPVVSGPAAAVVMLLLLIASAVLQLAVQYRTRSVRWSVGAGVAGVSVAVVISLMWPWHEEPLPVPAWARQESAVRLVVESQKGEFRLLDSHSDRAQSWQIGSARLALSGIEAGWHATVQLADATVQFEDGPTLATAGNGYRSHPPFESVSESLVGVVRRHVLGVDRLLGRWQDRSGRNGVDAIVVSQADFKKYSGRNGTYRGRFLVSLEHAEIVATLPLRAGAEFRDRQRRIVIDRVIPQTQAASVRVRRFSTATMFHSNTPSQLSFYLRNRDAAEAVAGAANGAIQMSAGAGLAMVFLGVSSHSAEPANGFEVASDLIRFPESVGPDESAVEISAEWLSRAELVIVQTTGAGSVVRAVEIASFEISAAAPPPSPAR